MCFSDKPDKPKVAPKLPEAAAAPKEAQQQVGDDDERRRRGKRATILTGNRGLMDTAVTTGNTVLGGAA